jgi:hypothetical protein
MVPTYSVQRLGWCASMDSQLIELVGRQRLIVELLRADLEVALPMRDRGIDLIVYADLRVASFRAVPIQMKAASESCFAVDQKYSKFPNLLIAYVWNVQDAGRAVTYALTYAEAVQVATVMGYTATKSWHCGIYTTTRPSQRLLELLEPFRMTTDKWRLRISQI